MGPHGKNQGPAERIRALLDGSGPERPAWAPQDESGHRDGSSPRDEPGPRKTTQSLWYTIRALVDGPEPR